MTKKKLLKGNYEPKKNPEVEDKKDYIPNFEESATAKIGGSIAFVKSKKVVKDG